MSNSAKTTQQRKSESVARNATKASLGQFMTPARVASFMVSLFPESSLQTCRLLDPGAGLGSLTSAFLDRWGAGNFAFGRVEAEAYEIDDTFRSRLKTNLSDYVARLPLETHVLADDFIDHAANRVSHGEIDFTHAILNPPYKKINSNSHHRLVLRRIGIETVNLYSAFVALALAMLSQGGHLVAIIPRSFCNGPYYRPFRLFVLERAAIRHIHLFGARDRAFKEDGVLQENVVVLLERGGVQSDVTISTSTDDTFADYLAHSCPFERVVVPTDSERFIRVPTSPSQDCIESSPAIRFSLAELGIEVSTGPVVDFRVREHLRDTAERGTAPLLYPGHFSGQVVEWPKPTLRKACSISCNSETGRWLFPNGFYTIVRRFSSKEEKRRVVASVVDPNAFPDAEALGFENHLNVFHFRKRGLPESLVRGLAMFLNTTAVDRHFRRFNGHTQVNATDLRMMKYPSREALIALGTSAQGRADLTQSSIDQLLDSLTA